MSTQNNESKNEKEQPLVDLELSEAQAESTKGGESLSADAGAGTATIQDFHFMKKVDK